MMKRICKFKYKLIIMLLILSILLGEFAIRPMSVKAVDALSYTYWDLWYSIAGAQKASMSAKEGPFTSDDVSRLKTQWSNAWTNYNIWLEENHPELSSYDMELQSYLDAKAEERDQARVQFQDFLFYLKDTASDLVPQAYDLIKNAKTTGLEMSQELWDAFRMYFDDVASDKVIDEKFTTNYTIDNLCKYISKASGGVIPQDFTVAGGDISDISNLLSSQCIFYKSEIDNYIEYRLIVPTVSNSTSARIGDYLGYVDSSGKFVQCHHIYFNKFLNNFKQGYYSIGAETCVSGYSLTVLGQDWNIEVGTTSEVYSPFIDYTVSQGCPVEVPETIPWRVYPKEETDDDTKIIPFPVEVPDEGTTEVPGEETTEKPNPDEDPDNDNDEENDPFPGIFPWFPNVPNSNPDENPNIPPWENPDSDSDSDPESGLSPDPDPNPDPDPDPPEPEPDHDPPGKVENYLNKLKTKFPFCIPFDMVALFKNLNKTQKAPKWTFSYTFHFGDKPYTWTIVVDMADYDKYIQIFREGFFVLFLVGLFFATRKLISWQID